MDKSRARVIASSPVMVNVTYNGKPIYIESVNENKGTANVHPVGQHKDTFEAPLDQLIES